MKRPFLRASLAALYIIVIVFVINYTTSVAPAKIVFIPVIMLSLFVLSTAVMGYLFLAEPFRLYMENHKPEALSFLARTVAVFACYVVLFLITIFFL